MVAPPFEKFQNRHIKALFNLKIAKEATKNGRKIRRHKLRD
jgi:hypothetical protein